MRNREPAPERDAYNTPRTCSQGGRERGVELGMRASCSLCLDGGREREVRMPPDWAVGGRREALRGRRRGTPHPEQESTEDRGDLGNGKSGAMGRHERRAVRGEGRPGRANRGGRVCQKGSASGVRGVGSEHSPRPEPGHRVGARPGLGRPGLGVRGERTRREHARGQDIRSEGVQGLG